MYLDASSELRCGIVHGVGKAMLMRGGDCATELRLMGVGRVCFKLDWIRSKLGSCSPELCLLMCVLIVFFSLFVWCYVVGIIFVCSSNVYSEF